MTDRRQQNRHLAWLIHECRTDWDQPGIEAALDKLDDRPLTAVIQAAAIAAETRRDQRSPWIIAQPGTHWRDMPQFEPTPQPPRFVPDPTPPLPADTVRGYIDQIKQRRIA